MWPVDYWFTGYWFDKYWVSSTGLGAQGDMRIVFDHDKTAFDQTTLLVTVSFLDSDNRTVAPLSANWTLTDNNNQIVNGRQNVSINPLPVINIVLSGDDLKYFDGTIRYLTVDAVYDSNIGSGLPLRDCTTFSITNCIKQKSKCWR